ncbi:MAG: hypothetical protein INH41_24280 [Myxococcaceae bacterium]|jgi:hypothetical protein|nr:hypothetical protein [Myxococcaceae bacterium]MCA3015520.1 hypothetical protein [Myxococcaceae bacterium]
MFRLAAVFVLSLAGCRRATPETPDGAFRVFAGLVAQREVKAAFGLLSQRTQAALGAKSKALSEASKGALGDEPSTLLVSPRRPSPLVSVAVTRDDGARATLAVTTCRARLDPAGACPTEATVEERVTMVRESQRWAVELPELVMP